MSSKYNNSTASKNHQRKGGGSRDQRNQQRPSIPMSGVPFGYIPAFLPGSASLVEQLDRRIMIVLRDGRHLVGILRSFDQFSNMVLDETSERRVLLLKKQPNTGGGDDVTCYYTDILLGLYLVRGDSMVLLGEVDSSDDDDGDEAVVTAGFNSTDSAKGLTGSGLLMGTSVKKEESKKHMKKVSLKEFEEIEAKMKKKKEGEDPINELTWEFDLDLVV